MDGESREAIFLHADPGESIEVVEKRGAVNPGGQKQNLGPLRSLTGGKWGTRLRAEAGVAELVDARDSKSRFFGSVGSIPTAGTFRPRAEALFDEGGRAAKGPMQRRWDESQTCSAW